MCLAGVSILRGGNREKEIFMSKARQHVGDHTGLCVVSRAWGSGPHHSHGDGKQVHSLCVDSRPGDRLRLAKGHPPLINYSSVKLSLKLTAHLRRWP